MEEFSMKKIVCMLMALLLMVGCICALASCIKEKPTTGDNTETPKTEDPKTEDNKEEEKKDEIVIPEGYTLYNDGKISFAYPKTWTKQDGSVTIIQSTNGNNISVAYEAKSDVYVNMTLETYNATLKPLYEAMGMTVSNVKIEKKETNGQQIVIISQKTTVNGMTMQQTQYIMAVGDLNYTVTVTEVVTDTELREIVFETYAPAK